MLNKLILFFLICSLIISFWGCTGSPSVLEADGITVTDAVGSIITLPKEPQKVAVLFSSFADIWVTAGGKIDITVGESVERGFANNTAILVDDGAGKSIDMERLITSEPDLVICSADIDAQLDAAKICNQAGIPAASFRVESFDDYLSLLELFTTLTGNPDLLQQYGYALKSEIAVLQSNYLATAAEPSILFIRASSSAKSTKAKTAEDHFACKMLEDLGTKNIADSAPVLLDGLSFEEILQQDPDYIFISTMGDEAAAIAYMDSVLQVPQWQSLSAVKNGHIVYLPKNLFQYKPNARWAEAFKYLIDILSK